MKKYTKSQADFNRMLDQLLIESENEPELRKAIQQAKNGLDDYCRYGVETECIAAKESQEGLAAI